MIALWQPALLDFANEVEGMTPDGFVRKFSSEVYEIARHVGAESTDVALSSIYQLHRRHADSVTGVMAQQIQEQSLPIVKATLPRTCLVSMVGAGEHVLRKGKHKASAQRVKKHGKGGLNKEVERLLSLHPDWNGVELAREIRNTTPEAVRKTRAWQQKSKH